jgi:predicted transcriptional regulator
MSTNTVNISFEKNLLSEIDLVAKKESRTRSELIREAARMYIERKNKWKDIFSFSDSYFKGKNIGEPEVQEEIRQNRRSKRKINV